MPLVKPCRMPWCPKTDCAEHERQPFEGAQGVAMPPGWAKTRARQLQRFPLCGDCGGTATQVHHRIPRYAGGTDADENLRSLCGPCHRHYPVSLPWT